MTNLNVNDLAKMIDHSLLHPTMTDAEIKSGCKLAMEYNIASVCLKPYSVLMAATILQGSEVKVGSVIGFPHGNNTTKMKVAETYEACQDGAVEIDMVINIGKLLSGDFDYVKNEIKLINETALENGAILKVIFENDYLTEKDIIKLCEICNEVGVAYIKTSSGYGFVKQNNGFYSYDGATEVHLKLMCLKAKASVEVKAAGGVRTLHDLLLVRSLGVTRVGATTTANILDEANHVLANGKILEEISPMSLVGGAAY